MLRIPGTRLLCLAAISACTQAQQTATQTTTASTVTGASLLDKPITVLDYELLRIHEALDGDVPLIKGMHLWRGDAVGGAEMQSDVTAIAFASDSAGVVVGYDVSTGRLTREADDVCHILNDLASRITATDSVSRRMHWARDNVMSHFMPRATAASATSEDRSRANDDLQRRMSIVITIYEHAIHRLTKCERQALQDSLTVDARPIEG